MIKDNYHHITKLIETFKYKTQTQLKKFKFIKNSEHN